VTLVSLFPEWIKHSFHCDCFPTYALFPAPPSRITMYFWITFVLLFSWNADRTANKRYCQQLKGILFVKRQDIDITLPLQPVVTIEDMPGQTVFMMPFPNIWEGTALATFRTVVHHKSIGENQTLINVAKKTGRINILSVLK